MNLFVRHLLGTLGSARRAPVGPLDPTIITRRVWPGDLDLSLHMNNARYLRAADLGRIDLIMRSGFSTSMRRNGWLPALGGLQVVFRREMRLFQRYRVETRVAGWDERVLFMEHRFVAEGGRRAGETVALVLAQAGMIDVRARRRVDMGELLAAAGVTTPSPPLAPHVAAFRDGQSLARAAAGTTAV